MASQFSTTASGGHRLGGGWGQTGREQGVRRSERRRAEREEQEVQGKIIRPGLAGIPLCSFLQDFWPAIVCVWMCVFPAGLFYAASVGDLGWLQGLAWGGYTSEPPNHITKACERTHTLTNLSILISDPGMGMVCLCAHVCKRARRGDTLMLIRQY